MKMKKILAFAFALLVIAVAVPAFAVVDVTALIFKDKEVLVEENIFKFKFLFMFVTHFENHDSAAEAQALANQVNIGNSVDAHPDSQAATSDDFAFGIDLHALITGSILNNKGIVGVNQDVGNMVNQANVVAVAFTGGSSAVSNTQAEGDQINVLNSVRHNEFLKPDLATCQATPAACLPDLSATITGSITGNTGIVGVNQNAGYMNNQANLVALAVAPGGAVALSEAALGQVNAGNTVTEIETVKLNLIENSINGNAGIIGVNQSSGNMNNQASAVSLAVLTSSVAITTP